MFLHVKKCPKPVQFELSFVSNIFVDYAKLNLPSFHNRLHKWRENETNFCHTCPLHIAPLFKTTIYFSPFFLRLTHSFVVQCPKISFSGKYSKFLANLQLHSGHVRIDDNLLFNTINVCYFLSPFHRNIFISYRLHDLDFISFSISLDPLRRERPRG